LAQACWNRIFSRFCGQNREKGAEIHFAIDPAK